MLLSGWRRSRHATSEAELMASAWDGSAERILLDDSARSTFGNALAAAAAAQRLGATEVVLVTSGWHGRRASSLLRAALRGSGSTVTLMATSERGAARARLRELACWLLVPLLGTLAARAPRTRRL